MVRAILYTKGRNHEPPLPFRHLGRVRHGPAGAVPRARADRARPPRHGARRPDDRAGGDGGRRRLSAVAGGAPPALAPPAGRLPPRLRGRQPAGTDRAPVRAAHLRPRLRLCGGDRGRDPRAASRRRCVQRVPSRPPDRRRGRGAAGGGALRQHLSAPRARAAALRRRPRPGPRRGRTPDACRDRAGGRRHVERASRAAQRGPRRTGAGSARGSVGAARPCRPRARP